MFVLLLFVLNQWLLWNNVVVCIKPVVIVG